MTKKSKIDKIVHSMKKKIEFLGRDLERVEKTLEEENKNGNKK